MRSDLSREALADALPGRAIRTYPGLVSTEAEALAWARTGAPDGAIVAAGHQAAPRGRGGVVWEVRGDRDLAFSIVLRPRLAARREGWLYVVAAMGLADALGGASTVRWPDEVRLAGHGAGAVGCCATLGPGTVEWAVVNVLVADVRLPRARSLAEIATAIAVAARRDASELLEAYRGRCETLGRHVRARMIPLGPAGPQVTGRAISVLDDGALLVETQSARRLAVRPQHLGRLDEEPEVDPAIGADVPPGRPRAP